MPKHVPPRSTEELEQECKRIARGIRTIEDRFAFTIQNVPAHGLDEVVVIVHVPKDSDLGPCCKCGRDVEPPHFYYWSLRIDFVWCEECDALLDWQDPIDPESAHIALAKLSALRASVIREMATARPPAVPDRPSGSSLEEQYPREFAVWQEMIDRCAPTNPAFCNEGKGIEACPEWRDSFATFLHEMGPIPNE